MSATDDEKRMVDEQIAARGVSDPRVLDAMVRVSRREFVPRESRAEAYGDRPLPIGCKQTISQPYIVAAMTEALGVAENHVVLEIGTGSGYQTAVLALLAERVDTIETVEILHHRSKKKLAALGYTNVRCIYGDGYNAAPEGATYDRIMITAAAPEIPETLVQRMRDGGRMVVPVGPPGGVQDLVVVDRAGRRMKTRSLMAVRFVPMTGEIQRLPVRRVKRRNRTAGD